MSPATRQTLSKLQLSEAGCLVDVHHDNDRTLADQRYKTKSERDPPGSLEGDVNLEAAPIDRIEQA